MQVYKYIQKELLNFGLSLLEAKVYLTMLIHGPLIAREIALKNRINRSSVYSVLERLKEKGLVSSYTSHGVAYFSAAELSRFTYMCEENIERNRIVQRRISHMLSSGIDQKIRKIAALKKTSVSTYQGVLGMKTAYSAILQLKQPIFCLFTDVNNLDIWKEYVLGYFNSSRHVMGVSLHLTITKELCESGFDLPFADSKFVVSQQPYIPSECHLVVAGQLVCYVKFSKGKFVTVLIEDSSYAELFLCFFNILWNSKSCRRL